MSPPKRMPTPTLQRPAATLAHVWRSVIREMPSAGCYKRAPCSRPRNSNAMPATSCCTRWAGPARTRSSARACWWSARAGSARRRCSISRRPASARIGIVDDDAVSLSNLQRQVIHGTPDIGAPKVDSAAAVIRRLNPHVAVELHPVRLDRRQRARSHRALRHRRRRLRQFRHALSRLRRLLLRQEAAGHRRDGHVRRHAHDHPRARARAPTARPIRPIAACSRSRRRPAPCRPAPRPACSAPWPACSAP